MKNHIKIIAAFVFILMPFFAFGQDGGESVAADPEIVTGSYAWLNGAIIAGVMTLTQLLKTKVWPKIPKMFLPVAAVGIGVGLQYLGSVTLEGVDFNALSGAIAAGLGVVIRDAIKGGQKDFEKLIAVDNDEPVK